MIHRGDLFDVLPTLEAESVDAGVTDPPYGIGFIGKQWDTFSPTVAERKQGLRQINKSEAWSRQEKRQINPNLKGRTVDGAISSSQIEYDYSVAGLRGFQEWTERWASEVFRVLKPGAHLLVCGAPRSFHRMTCGLEDAGFVIRDCLSWLYGQGFPKSLNLPNGLGTALKPSWEPIILARKPMRGTVAANVQTHGTGALNIDACRIETRGEGDYDHWREPDNIVPHGGFEGKSFAAGRHSMPEPHDLGRWPSNVLLDEEAAAMLDEQTGELVSGAGAKSNRISGWYEGGPLRPTDATWNADSGGASRFYYVAKPSREERNYGCKRNGHPTVKPVELMRWLVRLVTPPDGVVLDPFCGSGTTGMACRYELRRFIGIEREAEYADIAERRIAACVPLFGEAIQMRLET